MIQVPICIVEITGAISEEEGVRELESTGAFSRKRQCSSNKELQPPQKAQNSTNRIAGTYVLAFEQRLPASVVESWSVNELHGGGCQTSSGVEPIRDPTTEDLHSP